MRLTGWITSVILILSGCAAPMQRIDGGNIDPTDLFNAKQYCTAASYQMAPEPQPSPSYSNPNYNTSCSSFGSQINCVSSAYDPNQEMRELGDNLGGFIVAMHRNKLYAECMAARGYKQQTREAQHNSSEPYTDQGVMKRALQASKSKSAEKDFFVELTKLDQLRKEGILTESEFQELKNRFLDKD